jgi:hypothetical protein
MKAKLIKTGGDYLLRDMGGDVLAITNGTTEGRKLSKQNCDEIFGVFDLDELAEKNTSDCDESGCYPEDVFKEGFNKAMELNKDKLFTLEDMMNCWNKALKFQEHKQTLGEYIQSLQQPTEIEVEIEMICPHPMDTYKCGLHYGCDGNGCNHPNQIPYLDSEECLILKINKPE